MSNLMSNPFFNFRVLLRYDKGYKVHVAHCIETGNVATADNAEDAKAMIKELLEDEILHALKHRNIKNLLSSPASLDVLLEWMNAAQENDPKIEFLDVNFREVEFREIDPKNSSIRNEVKFAFAA